MYRVIVWGIPALEQRIRIEGMLDSDVELIGYMDSFYRGAAKRVCLFADI